MLTGKTKVAFLTMLGLLTAALIGMLIATSVSADHGDLVVVFHPQPDGIYEQFEDVGWCMGCHAGFNCTRDVVPGGLDGFKLKTDVPGEFLFIATATDRTTGEVFTVTVQFHVAEPAMCEGEVGPDPIRDGEVDVPVWIGGW